MRLKIIPLLILGIILLGLDLKQTLATANSEQLSNQQQEKLSKDVLRFNQELHIIKNEYVQPTSEHKLLKNAMQGMASGLDPHSSFLDADDLKELETATTGKFGGLGLEVAMEEGLLRVVTPIDDSPAQQAGIKMGDWIIRINNNSIQSLTLREAVQKMRGKPETSIQLLMLRKGISKPFTVQLKRKLINLHSVKGRLLAPGFAYIRISSFQENTLEELKQLVLQLKRESKAVPLKGLVLDLRNNPGGLLTTASDVANAFLDPQKMFFNQVIVYTKGQNPQASMRILAKPNYQIYDGALVLLINQGSASGAEIVAGALQDNKRAILLGTKTFGKGSVQTVIPLDNSSALKLTTALYYTPAGHSIQASGILPDVTLEELKVNTLDQNPIDSVYLHESELRGHLKNGNTETPKTIFELPATIESNDLLKHDYQLFEAFNLLKALIAVQEPTTSKASP